MLDFLHIYSNRSDYVKNHVLFSARFENHDKSKNILTVKSEFDAENKLNTAVYEKEANAKNFIKNAKLISIIYKIDADIIETDYGYKVIFYFQNQSLESELKDEFGRLFIKSDKVFFNSTSANNDNFNCLIKFCYFVQTLSESSKKSIIKLD